MTMQTRRLGRTGADVTILGYGAMELRGPLPPGARPPFPHDFSAANVRAGIEQSLRRLGTDHLDLVQVHMSPSRELMDLAIAAQGPLPGDLYAEVKKALG
jgi:aryl-alcohol dehydrogenase-like predicted oxidoreductase